MLGQTTIWSEDFEGYSNNTGIEGTGINYIGDYPGSVLKWEIDASGSDLKDNNDYLKIPVDAFHGRDINGIGIWLSETIDISSYVDITISADLWKVGGTMEANDSINFYYSLDGTAWTAIALLNDDISSTPQTYSISNINGDNLELKIEIVLPDGSGAANAEIYAFDNILVEGKTELYLDSPGSHTFTVPPNIYSIEVEAWGGGGGAGTSTNNSRGGGGGGAYALKEITGVIPNTVYNYFVGSGGSPGNNGTASWFNSNSLTDAASVVASAGFTASSGGNVGGTGGAIADCNGTLVNAGGNGGDRDNRDGGGGGGQAGCADAFGTNGQSGGTTYGGLGGGQTGNTGTCGTAGAGGNGGGDLGDGIDNNGQDGISPGGGGGGCGDDNGGGTNGTSGTGANGAVLISWIVITDPPNCTSPIAPADNATDFAVDGNLTWNSVDGASGYYIYFGTDASATNIENGTDLGNVNSYTPSANLDFLTDYFWKIVPYNAVGAAVSCETWFFTTEEISYCIPNYTNGTSRGEYIANVKLGDINNTTVGAIASPYYTYYDALSTDLEVGSKDSISLTVGPFANGNFVSVWIDFNQDGDFTDANEFVGELELPGNGTDSLEVVVPLDAELGVTRLRVREAWKKSGMDPCLEYIYGETEDYNVNIIPQCTPPNAPTLTSVSNPVCYGDDAVFTIKGTEGNIVTYTGTVGVPASPVAIGTGDSVDVVVSGVTSDVAMNLTNVSDATCDLDLTDVSETVTVTPLPSVSITGSSSIVIGETTQLSPTTGGTWISNNALVATVTNSGLVTGVGEGSSTFTFTNETAPNCEATTGTVDVSNAFDVRVNQPEATCNAADGVINQAGTDTTTAIVFEIEMTSGTTNWSPDWEIKFTLTPENLTNPADVPTINTVESVGGIGNLTLDGSTYTLSNIPSSSGTATVNISMNVVGDRYAELEIDFNITEAKTTISGNNINDKDSDDWNATQEIHAIPNTGSITTD